MLCSNILDAQKRVVVFLFFFLYYINILEFFPLAPYSFESSALNLGFQLSQLFATN